MLGLTVSFTLELCKDHGVLWPPGVLPPGQCRGPLFRVIVSICESHMWTQYLLLLTTCPRTSSYSTLFRVFICQGLYFRRFTRQRVEACKLIAYRQPSPLRHMNSRKCQLDGLPKMVRRWLPFLEKLSPARGQMNNLIPLLKIGGWKHFVTSWLGLEKKLESWSKHLLSTCHVP